MSWADIKASLKSSVHAAFGLPASYARAINDPSVPAFPIVGGVRYNASVRVAGGESRYGYAQIIQDVPTLRIDSTTLIDPTTNQLFVPVQDDVINVPSEGGDFKINNILPMDGIYHVVEVENFNVA